jgi:pyruvate/2-oxoacid:ferredoxin oxidoreductase beta subunit
MLVLTSTLQENQKVDIWQLLKAADKEFVPALSARRDTTQQNLAQSAASEEGPHLILRYRIQSSYGQGLLLL